MCVFVWSCATVGFSLLSLWFITTLPVIFQQCGTWKELSRARGSQVGQINKDRERRRHASFFLTILLTSSFDQMMTFNWFCQQITRTRLFHRYYSCCIYDLCDVFAAEDRKHWLMWISVGSETRNEEFPGRLETPYFLCVFIPFSASQHVFSPIPTLPLRVTSVWKQFRSSSLFPLANWE